MEIESLQPPLPNSPSTQCDMDHSTLSICQLYLAFQAGEMVGR